MKLNNIYYKIQEINLSKSEIISLKKCLYKAKRNMIIYLVLFFSIYAFIFSSTDKKGVSLTETYGLFNILSWLFLVTGIIAFILLKAFKIIELKKDLKEKLKLKQYSIVRRVGSYKGEYFLKLEYGKPRTLFSRTQSFYHLEKGDEIQFEVFKNAKTFIRLCK